MMNHTPTKTPDKKRDYGFSPSGLTPTSKLQRVGKTEDDLTSTPPESVTSNAHQTPTLRHSRRKRRPALFKDGCDTTSETKKEWSPESREWLKHNGSAGVITNKKNRWLEVSQLIAEKFKEYHTPEQCRCMFKYVDGSSKLTDPLRQMEGRQIHHPLPSIPMDVGTLDPTGAVATTGISKQADSDRPPSVAMEPEPVSKKVAITNTNMTFGSSDEVHWGVVRQGWNGHAMPRTLFEILTDKDVPVFDDRSQPDRSSACPPSGSASATPSLLEQNRSESDSAEIGNSSIKSVRKTRKPNRPRPVKNYGTLNRLAAKFVPPDDCSEDLTREMDLLAKCSNIEALKCTVLNKSSVLRKEFLRLLISEIGDRPHELRHRQNFYVSVLMKKEPDDLRELQFTDVIREMDFFFPEVLQLCMAIMLKPLDRTNEIKINEIVPRLATIYSILLFTRNTDLSRLQRVTSMCLLDGVCDQRVYDRFNRIGITSSYSVSLKIRKQIGDANVKLLIDAAKAGKVIRFIGDNINYTSHVAKESKNNHSHKMNLFANAAIVNDPIESSQLKDEPEIKPTALTLGDVLFKGADYKILRRGMKLIVGEIIVEHCELLSFIKEFLPKNVANEESVKKKSEVIPLKVLNKNEMKYQDVVKILEFYEELAQLIERHGGQSKFQTGGDQLTADREGGGLNLRIGNKVNSANFPHIQFVTFEFFHLQMNYLSKLVYKHLWNKSGEAGLGTLKCAAEAVSRTSVYGANVKASYQPCKDFFTSFVRCNVVEAVLDYFGMEEKDDIPTKNAFPVNASKSELSVWTDTVLGEIVDNYCFPYWSRTGDNDSPTTDSSPELSEDHQIDIITIMIDGKPTNVYLDFIRPRSEPPRDKVKDYAHATLEIGLTFLYLDKIIKSPSRKHFLSLCKLMMLQLKGRSTRSKYARELLRQSVVQLSLVTEKEAHQILSDCFVNLSGEANSCTPADLNCEWLVKKEKDYLKHLYHRDDLKAIDNVTAAIPYVGKIAENYDDTAGILPRIKGASNKSDRRDDENIILQDLRKVRPFEQQEGREHVSFRNICVSEAGKLDGHKVQNWFATNVKRFRP